MGLAAGQDTMAVLRLRRRGAGWMEGAWKVQSHLLMMESTYVNMNRIYRRIGSTYINNVDEHPASDGREEKLAEH